MEKWSWVCLPTKRARKSDGHALFLFNVGSYTLFDHNMSIVPDDDVGWGAETTLLAGVDDRLKRSIKVPLFLVSVSTSFLLGSSVGVTVAIGLRTGPLKVTSLLPTFSSWVSCFFCGLLGRLEGSSESCGGPWELGIVGVAGEWSVNAPSWS